ncbi:MAG: hypothetical protein WA432_01680 [Candidatus Babeliaceae bacterium]
MKISKIFILLPFVLTVFYLFNTNNTIINKEEKRQIIDAIMNYPMPNVIKRCQKDFDYTDEDMVILERELKHYLALSAFSKDDEAGNGMYSQDVDHLWHSFILFTKDYASFGDKYIGRFIHHVPETKTGRKFPGELELVAQDFQQFIKNYEEIFEEEVHPIWFLDMCEAQ